MNSGNGALVVREAGQHFFGRADLPQRGTQAVTQRFDVIEVFAKYQRARQFECVANTLGLHERVAVAVAADPGAEANQRGQRGFFDHDAVDVTKRVANLRINSRDGFEERKPEIAQAHANLVVNGGLRDANFVGLPERNHFGADGLFAVCGIGGGQRKPVEIFQLSGDAAALQ